MTHQVKPDVIIDAPPPPTDWRRVWRLFARHLPHEGLVALRDALKSDDPRLCQKHTVQPCPISHHFEDIAQACCPVGFAAASRFGGVRPDILGWPQSHAATVGEVEGAFADLCAKVDQEMGEPGGCRHLLNWVDDTPREAMIAHLLEEVERSVAEGEAGRA